MARHISSFADNEDQESGSDSGRPVHISGSEEEIPEGSQFSVLTALATALRRSLVMCAVGVQDDTGSLEIGQPMDVQHVSHVTFDRFDGFLGLPVELQTYVPPRAPSASVSIFGVSATSMQCSHDSRGNSVPTILLLMQRHLYSQGGLQAEGIFRINAENDQEVYVRERLNRGIVPHGIDVHCLAGLIKAWFRELPTGVLDSITPDQMMYCTSEKECSELVGILPPTEAALLDWAINLMADVVEHERKNKMNSRNIAMVFAPNMTQMADPLTALIHAVQVMNFLKTLIIKAQREREAAADTRVFTSCLQSPNQTDGIYSSQPIGTQSGGSPIRDMDFGECNRVSPGKFLYGNEQSFQSFEKRETAEAYEFTSGRCSPTEQYKDPLENEPKCTNGDSEGLFERLNIRRSVRKLCRHPLFQFSKSIKKSGDVGIINCGSAAVD